MCAFSYSTNCKEVNHDKSFINDSLQTFPGLILFSCPGFVCHFLIFIHKWNGTWAKEVDVSGKEARCGVRCATRDHLPMVGNVPDYDATLVEYASLAEKKDEAVSAPVYDDLFMFAALGSRGLCSAPLCAEILAAQMSEEPIPMDASTLAALNPNRLWVRKLLKGKAVKAG